MQYFYKFNNFKCLYNEKKFVLVALNLAFIAFFKSKKIKLSGRIFLWADGIFSKFYNFKKKIPGTVLIKKIILSNKIDKIVVLGDSSKKIREFLFKKFKKEIIHHQVPYASLKEIIKKIPKINKNNLYLITLPTPKQENVASYIIKNNFYYKIICIGGGLKIAAGDIQDCPNIIREFGLEFIWRLKTDSIRRLSRLFFSIILFIINFRSIYRIRFYS
jgi:UDP-N-acetyl-D-mannosaminuronic acid transferase (WecB/TagA/CpsF family)